MKRKHSGYWDVKENLIEESKKYHSRNEFKSNNESAYKVALTKKWIEDMVWLKPKSHKRGKGM